MFRIKWTHDIMNEDPKKRKKITGIHITCGYNCNFLDCPYRRECRHKSNYSYHNFSVNLRTLIYSKTNGKIDLKFPWYFDRLYTNLAGTTTCPYHVTRHDSYTCYQCKYAQGMGGCSNDLYHTTNYDEHSDPDHPGRCKYFSFDSAYACFDKKTGEINFDDMKKYYEGVDEAND